MTQVNETTLRRTLDIPDDAERIILFAESSHWDPNWLYTADDVGAGTEGLVLRATPLDTNRELTIRVLDPDGKPVEKVVLRVTEPSNEPRLVETGPDGRAHWNNMPAVPLRPTLATWRGATRDRPWLEPNFESATPDGQEITVRFRAGIPVEGTVEKQDSSPAVHAVVQVLQGDDVVRVARADRDGRFVAILDPAFEGTVQLRCQASAPGGKQVFSAVAEVQPGQAPVTLRLELKE